MSKEAYVSFKTAKLLKEKGFDWETIEYYSSSGSIYRFPEGIADVCGILSYPRPTQQMACSWLRDEQIDILPDCSLVDRKYSFHIINRYKTGGEIIHSDDMYDKYEDAIEAALQYCLTNLI